MSINNDNYYFSMFANCIITKGVKRSIICDLNRNRFDFIPNALYYLITNFSNSTIREIKEKFNKSNLEFINEYFSFLIDNEYGIYVTKKEKACLTKISTNFELPTEVSNCIIDIKKSSNHPLKEITKQMEVLNIRFCQIRLFDDFEFSEIEKIITECYSPLINIHLILKYNKTITPFKLKSIILKFNIVYVDFYGVHKEALKKYKKLRHLNINFSKANINSSCDCGKISPSYFSINRETFFESLSFNSCLNKKISIDVAGNIKNCPSLNKSYGNVKDTHFLGVIKNKEYKKMWYINKDKIKTCKDCEFRYICTDCRAFIENPTDIYSKPLKCGYNPHTNIWEDWSKNPLNQKVKTFYGIANV